MEPGLKLSQEHNVTHYARALHHLQSGEVVLANEPQILSIAEKMRYFQQKYGQRIENIMDIVSMAEYLKLQYPEESRDREILASMSDTVMESFDKRASPNLKAENAENIESLIQKNKLLEAILNCTSM